MIYRTIYSILVINQLKIYIPVNKDKIMYDKEMANAIVSFLLGSNLISFI